MRARNQPDNGGPSPAEAGGATSFLSRYRRLLLALVGLGALPFFTSLVLKIGPPWPSDAAIASYTLLVNASVLLCVYTLTPAGTAKKRIQRNIRNTCLAFGAVLVVYVLLKAFYCHDDPGGGQIAVGFILSEENKPLRGLTDDQLLLKGNFVETDIWEPWTVYCVRAALLLTWLVLFSTFSAAVAYGVVYDAKRRRPSPSKKAA
jgi:hypothetical protein